MRHLVPCVGLLLLGCGLFEGLGDDARQAEDEPSSEGTGTTGGPQAGASGSVDGGDVEGDVVTPPPPPPLIINCFAAGTPIATPAGERAIEELAVGDSVWAFDTARGVRVPSTVLAVHRHPEGVLGKLSLPSGRELQVTAEHPVYLPEQDRFVPVGELQGDELVVLLELLDDEGEPSGPSEARVSDAAPSYEPAQLRAPTFDITVAAYESYFAAGLLVHNKSPPRCPNDDWSPTACMPIGPPPIVVPPIETCFGAGTLISTPSGDRPIERLSIGDAVWAFDTQAGVRVQSTVSAVHQHDDQALGALTLADGRALRVTPNHPIYLPERDAYLPAGELTGSESLLQLNGDGAVTLAVVDGFEDGVDRARVYNLTVEGTHNYFAGGVLVHNKEPPPCPNYDWNTKQGCDRPLELPGPTCEAYPTAAISGLEYTARLRQLFGADVVPDGIDDPAAQHPRNDFLTSMFSEPTAPGRAIARWLRVPTATLVRARATGSLDLELAGMLLENVGGLLMRPLGAGLGELLRYPQPALSATLTDFYTGAATEHVGVLSEGAFLRTHTTPSDRGSVIGEQLLCGAYVPHAPMLPAPTQTGTRYDAYAELSTNPFCAQCHMPIEGLGLALEAFDAMGSFRSSEAGETVVPTGWLPNGRMVEGPLELADALLTDPMLVDCVARSLLADALARPLVAADECSVQWIRENMGDQLDMRAALLAVTTSPAFLHARP